jgi:hypothetical protein
MLAILPVFACGKTVAHGPGGEAGAGGTETSSGVAITRIQQNAVTKLDLLLVVDNSISMGDKQALLAESLPLLVERLVSPRCVRDCTPDDDCTTSQLYAGIPLGESADASGQCAEGHPELNPLRDLHVGVITSSLGSRGATEPRDVCVSAEDNDHAHLLGQLRGLTGTWDDVGFLAWDPDGQKSPHGDADPSMFVTKFSEMVQSAGEHGCGYEGTLEAWYRFLIDPEPLLSVVVSDAMATPSGIDQTILDQRAAFLRPDSAVVIAILSDENDCSIIEDGLGWTVATATPMFRGTSRCSSNPNHPCCQSCGDSITNEGCPPVAEDAACQSGTLLEPNQHEDDLNLRCWQQKARFGVDLLYPISRYLEGLTSRTITTRSGLPVANPLFAPAALTSPRDPGLVFLMGIVGVPWQDLADEESLSGPGLRYRDSTLLDWGVILGDPSASPPVPPRDPLMVESPDERTYVPGVLRENPFTGDPIVSSSSDDPQANPINGHEQVNLGNHDLQYACIFPLATPRVCDQQAFDADEGCDCFDSDLVFNRPLCQPPGGGLTGITQYYAKAYPGSRHLEVLKGFGYNAIVASICPKVLDQASPDYGYNPAMDALIQRVRYRLVPQCLQEPLPIADDGRTPCTLVEVSWNETEACECEAMGYSSLATGTDAALRAELKSQQSCGVQGGTPCEALCACEIPQLSGDDLRTCQNQPEPPPVPGYCYLNAMQDEPNVGSANLLQNCSLGEQRLIRFTGRAPEAFVVALCDMATAP